MRSTSTRTSTDRASAGTATVIALSGMTFLPGKQFNLTANVGTYRGAYAGALQIGAMISENMAFNAGVATGFNKGGKLASACRPSRPQSTQSGH